MSGEFGLWVAVGGLLLGFLGHALLIAIIVWRVKLIEKRLGIDKE